MATVWAMPEHLTLYRRTLSGEIAQLIRRGHTCFWTIDNNPLRAGRPYGGTYPDVEAAIADASNKGWKWISPQQYENEMSDMLRAAEGDDIDPDTGEIFGA